MAWPHVIPTRSVRLVLFAVFVVAAAAPVQAQQAPSPLPSARIIVTGEGGVTLASDYAEIASGVTTRAKTAREASNANSKAMAALNSALQNAGVVQTDVQTLRFSVSPVYGPPQQNAPPPLVGFSVSNELRIKVRQLEKVGAILDALIGAGATDAGSVQFLHSDTSKALDQARQAALADARRKAELYAQASGLKLGGVAWITEAPDFTPPSPISFRTYSTSPQVPISPGQDTLHVQITVGFEIAH